MFSAWTSSARHGASSRLRFDRHGSAYRPRSPHPWRSLAMVAGTPLLSALLVGTVFADSAGAATQVQLNTAAPFAVLAGTGISDVPTSSIIGDVGLSPATGADITGLTQAELHGTSTIYTTDGTGPTGNVDNPNLLTGAKNDLTAAYLSAAGDTPTNTFTATDNQLGGQTLVAGVYAFGGATTANITAASPLVLNGQDDPNAVFVFQASSTLVTAPNSSVVLENDASACNVFWQVTSSATLNTGSTFVGTIMALTSATLDTGATVQGRVLARTGAVSLDANTITAPSDCALTTPPTTTTTTTTAAPVATTAPTGSVSSTGSVTSGAAASGTGSAAGSTASGSVVPAGSPHTGFGGASHSRDGTLIGIGVLALVGSAGVFAAATRRRLYASRTKALPPSS